MKTLKIPFISGLEKMSPESFAMKMKMEGAEGDISCANWPERFPYCPETTFLTARSRTHIAVSYSVLGLDLRARALEDNGRSWEDSCCEFFISPDGKEYYNIETTCIGSVLMARGRGRTDRTLLPAEEVARVIRRSSLGHKPLDLRGGPYRWTVEILIPFDLIGLCGDSLPGTVTANFYKCADLTAHQHFVSWNPVGTEEPDFHRPEFFGILQFD